MKKSILFLVIPLLASLAMFDTASAAGYRPVVEQPEESEFQIIHLGGITPEEVLARQAFGEDPRWEDLYFERGKHVETFKEMVSGYWSVGDSFWQTEVLVRDNEVKHDGGPLYFEVHYPFYVLEHPLVYEVKGDENGVAVFGVSGAYVDPEDLGVSCFIVLLLIVMGMILFVWIIPGIGQMISSLNRWLEHRLTPRGWRILFIIAMMLGAVTLLIWLF